MIPASKHTKKTLLKENQQLQEKLTEYKQLLDAIRHGEVDAILQSHDEQSHVVAFEQTQNIYRELIEKMGEGALIVSDQALILYANQYMADILQAPLHKITGTNFDNWFFPSKRNDINNTLYKLAASDHGTIRQECSLRTYTGIPAPVYLAINKGTYEPDDHRLNIIVTDLSEQKRNQAIEADEKLARAIIEQVTDAIVVCDPSGTILRANSTARRLSITEPINQSFDNSFQLKDENGNVCLLSSILELAGCSQIELLLTGPTGHYDLLVGANFINKNDTDDAIIGIVISLSDITFVKNTERNAVKVNDQLQQQLQLAKRSRRALLNVVEDVTQSEQRLKKIASRLPGIIFEYHLLPDGSHRIPYISDAISRLYGINPDTVRYEASPLFERIFPDDLTGVNESIKTSARDLSDWRREWRSTDKNGNLCWIDANATPEKQSDGSIIWYGFLSDATERKNNEFKIKLAANVFENSREGIIITDQRNNIAMVNKAFTNITGYSEDDVLGKNPNLLSSGYHDENFYRKMWKTITSQGYWEGEIWNQRKDGSIYPEWLSVTRTCDSEYKTTGYIRIFEDITQRKEYEQRIHRLAHYDSLTELPNRILFSERVDYAIAQAQRHNKKIAILFCDIDHFKNINDTLGHKIGDFLLRDVAQRMTSATRKEDTISRQGGDEFIILLPDTNADGVAYVAEKIQDAISRPYNINSYEMTVTCSIGITLYPDDGADFETLSKNADIAMYHAKHIGRNNYFFYNSELHRMTARTIKLEKDIYFAVGQQQFEVYYQPQVSIATGKISGLEALLRWSHPDFGMIPPHEFIPIAENSGQILRMGEWVARTAAQQMKDWFVAGIDPIKLSVNLSVRELKQPLLVEKVEKILAETGLEPHLFQLEITESMLMEDQEKVIATLQQINDLGIHLSIDDFGIGYSSLSYVKRLPVDQLKIDKSFVQDMLKHADDAIITKAIISLGHSLGMEVIAEGVEDSAQLDFLRSYGCDYIQGYLFSKPLPADDVAQLLADSKSMNPDFPIKLLKAKKFG